MQKGVAVVAVVAVVAEAAAQQQPFAWRMKSGSIGVVLGYWWSL